MPAMRCSSSLGSRAALISRISIRSKAAFYGSSFVATGGRRFAMEPIWQFYPKYFRDGGQADTLGRALRASALDLSAHQARPQAGATIPTSRLRRSLRTTQRRPNCSRPKRRKPMSARRGGCRTYGGAFRQRLKPQTRTAPPSACAFARVGSSLSLISIAQLF